MNQPQIDIVPGEEEILIWNFFDNRSKGFFVEIGANHPVNLSQTYFLEKNGWSGILVEPLPDMANLIREKRIATLYEVACGAPGETRQIELFIAGKFSSTQKHVVYTNVEYTDSITVPIMTVDSILKKENYPDVNFLSIDTEGTELNVLKGIDFTKTRPNLMLIEYHVLSLDIHWYLASKGYKLIRRTGVNNWYVPKEFLFEVPLLERIKLWRKMYLGTPLRILQWYVKKHTKHRKFRAYSKK